MATCAEGVKIPKRRTVVLSLVELRSALENEGVCVPQPFEKAIRYTLSDGEILRVGKKDLAELFKIARFWKGVFFNKQDYDKFVMRLVISLYSIHCVSVNTNEDTRAYVGRGDLKINTDMPVFKESYVVTTAMSLGGKAYFPGCPEKYCFS